MISDTVPKVWPLDPPVGRVGNIRVSHPCLPTLVSNSGNTISSITVVAIRLSNYSVVGSSEDGTLLWLEDEFGGVEELQLLHIENLLASAATSSLTVFGPGGKAYIFAAGDWPNFELRPTTK